MLARVLTGCTRAGGPPSGPVRISHHAAVSNVSAKRRVIKRKIIKPESSSEMMKQKVRKPETVLQWEAIESFFPISPGRFDFDETKMSNIEWRNRNRHTETARFAEWWGIFPDVYQPFDPRVNLVVKYPNATVYRGNRLTPTQTAEVPQVSFPVQKKSWTLVMVDPDAPTPENPAGQFIHWVVGNIPADKVADGQTLVGYCPAAPPKGSRFHRYVFILFEQKNGVTDFSDFKTISDTSADGRLPFNTREFAQKYNLKAKGISFFHAEWDTNCPAVYAKLGVSEPVIEAKKAETSVEKVKSSPKQYLRM